MHVAVIALSLLAAALAGTAVAAPRTEAPPASLPVSAPWAETALVEDNGRILVRVSIGGNDSLIFILDTAAQGGAISPETRDLLGLDPASAEAVNVRGASGPTTLTRMRVPPVTVAGETVDGLRAVVMDMARYRRSEGPPYAGILGADFLRHFDVELDVPGGRMRLWRHREGSASPAPPRAPANLANVAPVEGFVAFDVAVGNTVARAILDSGAPTSTLNWHAAAAAGVTRESPGLALSRSAAGVSGDVVETHSHRIDGIAVEELRFPPLQMSISDLPVFQGMGFGERPAMLLGADLLRECRVFISYSERRVHLCGEAAG
jgi:predicted aspartyl protease